MRRLLLAVTGTFIVAILAIGGVVQSVHAQNAQNFTISSFTADQYIGRTDQKVPTMKVGEVIVAEFPQSNQNHGIVRAIPTEYKGQPLVVHIESITNAAGQPYPYNVSRENNNLILKIGDPNHYAHGQTTYQITYTLKNQISFWPDHDELYWNVNGTQWQQPFGVVTARVHIPGDLAGNLQDRQVCYTGQQGNTSQNCSISRQQDDQNIIVTTTARDLPAGGNLTYVLGFTAGTFSKDVAAARAKAIRLMTFAGLLLVVPLVTLGVLVAKWRRHGRDAKGKGTIVPEYTPPKDLTVLTSDVIMREQLLTPAITATVIELAVNKYLAIYELQKTGLLGKKPSEYELELLRLPDSLTTEQQEVVRMLFTVPRVGKRINLKELRHSLQKDVTALAKSVPKKLFEQGYFINNPARIRNRYYLWGGLMLGIAGFATILIAQVWWPLSGLTVGCMIAGVVVLIAARAMPARSAKGVQARDYLKGLKMYMELAEADRITYLQSPEGVRQWGDPADPNTKVKLFEKLLPYAMIFGIEKNWAKQFKDIYTQPPDWYHGNWSTFNTVLLVGSLNSFGTASGAGFAAPTSSGSSGFGGGFSGGGGGGGGGGGW